MDSASVNQKLDELAKQGIAALADEGVDPDQCSLQPSLDCRYTGQSYTLNIPWQGKRTSAQAFHRGHERLYGHQLQTEIELVNLRCGLRGPTPDVVLESVGAAPSGTGPRRIPPGNGWGEMLVWARETLGAGQEISGPALVTETVATTYVASGWLCRVDGFGNLVLATD